MVGAIQPEEALPLIQQYLVINLMPTIYSFLKDALKYRQSSQILTLKGLQVHQCKKTLQNMFTISNQIYTKDSK